MILKFGLKPKALRKSKKQLQGELHSFIHQGRQFAVGSLLTCLLAYRQR